MKIFQPFFLLLLCYLSSTILAQDNCDAVCQERVNQAVAEVRAEKERADAWGWEQKNGWDAANAETERMRSIAIEQESTANELRGQLQNAQRSLEELKVSTSHEIDTLRSKAEEASSNLGSVQFALDEANDHIKELESARISFNFKGIIEDVKGYWSKVIGFWTGLKEKKEDEEF